MKKQNSSDTKLFHSEQKKRLKDEIENINDDKDDSETVSATTTCAYNSDSDNDEIASDKHEEEVSIDIKPCPLRFVKPCNWLGPRQNPNDMILHCLEEHPKNTFIEDNQKLIVTKFTELVPRRYFILFCELDNIFRLTWDVDVTTRLMRFGVYFFYDFGLDLEYLYEIDFLCARKKAIKLKGPCYFLPDEEEMFLEKNYFTLPYDLVKKFCDSDGTLTLALKISCEPQVDED